MADNPYKSRTFNRTGSGREGICEVVATSDDMADAIMAIYLSTRTKWGPWQIKRALEKAEAIAANRERRLPKDIDLNSVRRTITNLTASRHLRLMAETRIGEKGKPEHYWIINVEKYPSPVPQPQSLF